MSPSQPPRSLSFPVFGSVRRTAGLLCSFFLAFLAASPGRLLAHQPSETYLNLILTATNLDGHWDIALLDLQQGLALGPTELKTISTAELTQRQEALALDTVARLVVKADGAVLDLKATDYFPVQLNRGDYLRVQFEARSLPPSPKSLELDARVLFTIDPNTHGLLRLAHDGLTDSVAFNADHPKHVFVLGGPPARWRQWTTFVQEGVWHIWIGFDHILFLLALLLPAVLRREGQRWEGVNHFRPALIQVFKIVTAFTLAHSLTLSLAACELISLPSRFVESVIAASVALAAANNLWPWFQGKGWLVAFGFGLIHGFGFASVLAELGLNRGTLALALVGFNVGVELGQLAIVAVFLPLAFNLRGSEFYRTVIFKFGSAIVVLIATAWMIERMFGLSLTPGLF